MNNIFSPNIIGAIVTGFLNGGAWRETNGVVVAATTNKEGDIFVFIEVDKIIYKRDITSVRISI